VKQYEIRWASLPEPIGRRPVLLLSRDAAYGYLNKAIVAEVTTRIRGIPQEIGLGPREGLPSRCAANLDNLHTVALSRLGEGLGVLRPARVPEVKRALGYVLSWPELAMPE